MSGQPGHLPFLLEIGSEEIPARFIPTAMREIETRLDELLTAAHLDHGRLRVLATPRRLAVLCERLATAQPDRQEELKGPPVKAAFDAEGNPTRAALGFAEKAGVALEDLERASDQRGEYLLARRILAGRSAVDVLGESLPGLVLSLPFRKTMRWGELDIEYARPLQWLLCLLGERVVPFTLGDLRSGRTTRGHRTLSGDAVREVPDCAAYEGVLRDLSVIADGDQRRRIILERSRELLAALDPPGVLQDDEELLDEVVDLCEHPTPLAGRFAGEFFALPQEVITTALKAHQRYFAVRDAADGSLLPFFVAVRDGGTEHLATVRAGNERVLQARLADALFYWRFDQRRSPDEHAAALAQVTWLEGFGSVAEHTGRAARLAEHLWRTALGDGRPVPAVLRRAAALSRFDLVTEMIKDGKEFTKLEGLIAARYAEAAGEDPAVCRILTDSLLPRSAAGELPSGLESAVLSVAWRLDTLTGCWLAGFAPTGAKDPYALRRHGLAILRIILARSARVDLEELLAGSLELHACAAAEAERGETTAAILDFLQVRLEGWLVEGRRADPDVVRAILPVRRRDPAAAAAWIEALGGFRNRDDFLLLARSFKRTANILGSEILDADERGLSVQRWLEGGRGASGEDFSTLAEPAERQLREAVAGIVPALREAEAQGSYIMVFEKLTSLGPVIDRYFDSVRVNTEDAAVRDLRRAFLREVHALFRQYADFAQVAPPD